MITGQTSLQDYTKTLMQNTRNSGTTCVKKISLLHTGFVEDPSSRGDDNGAPKYSSPDGQDVFQDTVEF